MTDTHDLRTACRGIRDEVTRISREGLGTLLVETGVRALRANNRRVRRVGGYCVDRGQYLMGVCNCPGLRDTTEGEDVSETWICPRCGDVWQIDRNADRHCATRIGITGITGSRSAAQR